MAHYTPLRSAVSSDRSGTRNFNSYQASETEQKTESVSQSSKASLSCWLSMIFCCYSSQILMNRTSYIPSKRRYYTERFVIDLISHINSSETSKEEDTKILLLKNILSQKPILATKKVAKAILESLLEGKLGETLLLANPEVILALSDNEMKRITRNHPKLVAVPNVFEGLLQKGNTPQGLIENLLEANNSLSSMDNLVSYLQRDVIELKIIMAFFKANPMIVDESKVDFELNRIKNLYYRAYFLVCGTEFYSAKNHINKRKIYIKFFTTGLEFIKRNKDIPNSKELEERIRKAMIPPCDTLLARDEAISLPTRSG